MAGVNYLGYAQAMGQRNPFAEGVNAISGTIDDIGKRRIQEQESQRRNRLADLQIEQANMQMDKSRREQDYQQGLESAMQNPQTTANPASLRQLAAYTPEALEYAKMTPEQQAFAAQAGPGSDVAQAKRQFDIANAPAVAPTVTESPAQAGAKFAASKGRFDDSTKLFDLDAKMNEMAAQILETGGDPVAYHQAKAKLKQFDSLMGYVRNLAKTPGALKAAWPMILDQFPDAAAMSPDMITIDENGVAALPLIMDGKKIEGAFVTVDEQGKKTVHKIPQDTEAMLDKRLAAQAANTNKQIAAADARAARAAANKGEGGGKPDPVVVREAVKDLPKLRKEANMASASQARLDQMISLYDKGAAGGLKGNILQAVSGVFDVPATSEAELFKKLASAGAGQLRSTVIGPGQVSNYEQKLLQSVSGGGNGARTAIRELLLFYKQEADRTISNYNEAVDAAASLEPTVAKAFKKAGGNKPTSKQSGGLVPDGKGGFVWRP